MRGFAERVVLPFSIAGLMVTIVACGMTARAQQARDTGAILEVRDTEGTIIAPMQYIELERGQMSAPVPTPDALPPNTGRLVAAAALIAGVLRLLVGLFRSPLVGSFWSKLPWVAQWAVLGVLTTLLAAADAYATGGNWTAAMVAGVGGLFTSWGTQKLQKVDRKVNP